VDNAVEYTSPGGSIDVESRAANGKFTLRVVNTADNLDECDLTRLFDRFWRKDAARTSDGHTGLGLSLARAFAHVIGCELTAAFAGPSRLALTLTETRSKSPIREAKSAEGCQQHPIRMKMP
jgi:signal transduction histidine kinase